ncbi:DNA polymerase III subunit beta [Dehalococcoides mccartyi]|jgi:DNA polymerase-3 subunit beta|uniref:Beta sliding clamp n=4 Tax=Dehalococcoides TaxID=61434 RepID=A0A142VAL9_9CHLR|nr:DNA polymerase III subunit beta [Dehalococcoides mccartyi]AII61191.1 DNA polymerase III subunit beta [Dehalococcoides mccartyi CG5]AMU86880.1 DNA polymerase III subunit beta [Dehalococcoides mccartyi]AOV99668.1 DNA polymerase III beta subunit [Dehalococcoides mccartyi]MBA2085449.1 DNA polymerase III beta subunit [Dehalococcoides mccartyi]QBX64206.1 DNA polymerase III subunit beta [Dehalococcoides mccartyi]
MKLTCLQENLNKGLNIVGKAAAGRTTLPITNNVLISTDDGRLKLAATNLEMAISCWIGAKIEEEGSTTIPAKLLTEFVSSLPNDKIDLSLNAKSKALNIKCARFEARITGVDSKDFPPIPKVENGISTKVSIDAFRQAVSEVVFASAADESRPVLTGVNAEFEGSTLTLAAADGFRLAVYKLPLLESVKTTTKVIIPARTLGELSRLASMDEEEALVINVDTAKSQILFRLKNIELVSQLVQGNFPQYNQIIPQSFTTRVVVDANQFLMATKTATIFARDGGGIVRLMMNPGGDTTPGKLTISARSEEVGDNTGELDAVIQGEEAKIAFNGKYLLDVLGVLKAQQVALEVTSPSSPGVIKPVGADNYIHVIMPMFVQW